MLKRIILAEDALDSSSWVSFDCENICEFLASKYERLPSNAKIYHSQVSLESDVTPIDEKGIKALQHLEGTFYVVMYPHEPMTIFYVFMVVIAAAAFLMTPAVPSGLLRNQNLASPNNELSQRENKPRINGRIPDIFGTVSSTPDLLAPSYKIYENNEEFEYVYACVGRGQHEFSSDLIFDDTTKLSSIEGSCIEIYSPSTSPNSGDLPQLQIGSAITETFASAKRESAINGQILPLPNSTAMGGGDPKIKLRYDDTPGAEKNIIESDTVLWGDVFTDFFEVGDLIDLWNAKFELRVFNEITTHRLILANAKFNTDENSIEVDLGGTYDLLDPPSGPFNSLLTGGKLGGPFFETGDLFEIETGAFAGVDYEVYRCSSNKIWLVSPELININWDTSGIFEEALVWTRLYWEDVEFKGNSGQFSYVGYGPFHTRYYKVLAVNALSMEVESETPSSQDWSILGQTKTNETEFSDISITLRQEVFTDFVEIKSYEIIDAIYINLIAPRGLYWDDGITQKAVDVDISSEVEAFNSTTGLWQSIMGVGGTLKGSAFDKKEVRITRRFEPEIETKRIRIKLYRATQTNLTFKGTVADEVRWKDLYSVRYITKNDFGDITTLRLRTAATSGALAIKNRKLNLITERIVPTPISLSDNFNYPYFKQGWQGDNYEKITTSINSLQVEYVSHNTLQASCKFFGLSSSLLSVSVSLTLSNLTTASNPTAYLGKGINISSISNFVVLVEGVNSFQLTLNYWPYGEPIYLVFGSDDYVVGKMFKIENINIGAFVFAPDLGTFLLPSNQSKFENTTDNTNHAVYLDASQLIDANSIGFEFKLKINVVSLPTGGLPLTIAMAKAFVAITSNIETLILGLNEITLINNDASAYALKIIFQVGSALVTESSFVLSSFIGGVETTLPCRASDVIEFVALDPKIGNRQLSEIDTDNLASTMDEVDAYFGSSKASEFNYTFDNSNLSFEETVAIIANAVHSIAYRRGHQIKLSFEKQTDVSTLLFNHRNKLPGSEVRTVAFGNSGNFDGVEYEYVDPEDDALVTMYLPPDQSAINPKKVESIGIRSKLQAHFHANRIWNKIQHQNTTTTFDCTEEADLLIIQDRVLVADGTRPNTQDGYVDSQNGLELTLSQSVEFEVALQPYVMFLQLPDGTVQAIGVTEGSSPTKVILSEPPTNALSLADDAYVKTAYVIVGNTSKGAAPFIVTEKTHNDGRTLALKGINYDDRYYANDTDFINAVVDEDGNIL